MRKQKLLNKFAFIFAFIIFCVSIFSAMPATALSTEDLTLGGLVPEKTIEEMGHMQISDNLADELNGVEYINEDGTRTAYLFSEPIKYEDENNEIKRIDNSLRKAILKNGWKNTANRFSFFVHEELQNGVELTYDEVTLKATPILSALTETGKRSNTSRISANKVGRTESAAEISYESTYTGYTTNVTVPASNGLLFAMDLSGDISSVTTENGQVTVSMNDGSTVVYTLLAAFAGEEYLWFDDIAVSVIQAKKDTTRIEYTVSEDATAENITLQIGSEVVYTTDISGRSTSSLIISADTVVYSGNPNRVYGIGSYCTIGTVGENKDYRSFVYMDISALSNIPYNRILGANYRVCELTNTETPFQVEAYMATSSWAEMGITWSNMPTYNEERITTVNVSHYLSGIWYDFYITRAVMAWLQGVPNNGIMLKSRTEGTYGYRQFASRENSSCMPSLSVTYTTETTSMDNIGIEDGEEYYIKNKNSMKYLTASGNTSTSNVIQSDWTGAANQKWTVTYDGEGYYKLSPANASNLVLDTNGGNNTNGANIQLYSPNTGLGQEFKFIRNWDGSYQIVTRLSNDVRGLKVENNSETNGGNVYHWYHSVDWMKSDDWTLEPVEKGFASLYCFTSGDVYGNLNTYRYSENILSPLASMGYSNCLFVDSLTSIAYELISDDSVFVFSGHGGKSCIMFKENGEDNMNGGDYIWASGPDRCAIDNKSHNDLAKLQLVVFMSCETGADEEGTGSNMVGVTYRKGTHFVIAYPTYTRTPNGDIWVQQFLAACADGKTIYQAMNAADEYLYDVVDTILDPLYGGAVQRHMLGDYSMQLYHSEEVD